MSTFLKSLVRSEAKSCAGKIKFPREDSAQRSAAEMMSKKPGEVFEHYKCSYCDGWHIGHHTSFDWIPESHVSYTLMLNRYKCLDCDLLFLTNTVVPNRIMVRFPAINSASEWGVVCPKCKVQPPQRWERRCLPLKDVEPDSTEPLESLWERAKEEA